MAYNVCKKFLLDSDLPIAWRTLDWKGSLRPELQTREAHAGMIQRLLKLKLRWRVVDMRRKRKVLIIYYR